MEDGIKAKQERSEETREGYGLKKIGGNKQRPRECAAAGCYKASRESERRKPFRIFVVPDGV